MVAAINAIGNHVPSMYIFPRVNFKSHMLKGAPTGSHGVATVSGWINDKIFLEYLDHFIRYTGPTKENKILLVLDNHHSHVTIEAIDRAKSAGIVLLTMPPHTGHKVQPLDRTVFGPYKTIYNKKMTKWMARNP